MILALGLVDTETQSVVIRRIGHPNVLDVEPGNLDQILQCLALGVIGKGRFRGERVGEIGRNGHDARNLGSGKIDWNVSSEVDAQ